MTVIRRLRYVPRRLPQVPIILVRHRFVLLNSKPEEKELGLFDEAPAMQGSAAGAPGPEGVVGSLLSGLGVGGAGAVDLGVDGFGSGLKSLEAAVEALRIVGVLRFRAQRSFGRLCQSLIFSYEPHVRFQGSQQPLSMSASCPDEVHAAFV